MTKEEIVEELEKIRKDVESLELENHYLKQVKKYPEAFIIWIEHETEYRHAEECWHCDDEKFCNVEDLYNHYKTHYV